MAPLIDLNAPDNDIICSKLRKLWRSAIIQALKDGTESHQKALTVYHGWAATSDCIETCEYAGLDSGMVKKLLLEACESEKKRNEHKDNIFYLTKKRKSFNGKAKAKPMVDDLFSYHGPVDA